jgi:2'-5' RNA ligase
MVELGYQPHLTLIVTGNSEGAGALERALATIAGHVPSLVALGLVRAFPASEVVYLECAGGLQALQRLAADVLPLSMLHEHYRPETWTPHVTLQTRGDTARALAVVRERWNPREATLVTLEVISFPPATVRSSLPIRQP